MKAFKENGNNMLSIRRIESWRQGYYQTKAEKLWCKVGRIQLKLSWPYVTDTDCQLSICHYLFTANIQKTTGFLASDCSIFSFVGGLVGLFTGISMLTISEIFMWIARDVVAMMSALMCRMKTKKRHVI